MKPNRKKTQKASQSSAPSPVADPSAPKFQETTVSPAKRLLFKGICLFFIPVVIIFLLELVFRLAGLGYPTSFFLKSRVANKSVVRENRLFGLRFFTPGALRTPRPMSFCANKDSNTIRIFVFGESAAFGDPEPAYGFPRVLQYTLAAMLPTNKIEVINAAMTAINSHTILEIAKDCAAYNGNFWLLYIGNNEVVGPFGAGTVFGKQSAGLNFIRFVLKLKNLRTVQLLDLAMLKLFNPQRARESWGGMEMFLKFRILPDNPKMQVVYENFQQNMTDIINLGKKAGAKIILSTVAVNLKDCPPFGSDHAPGLSTNALAQWNELYNTGLTHYKEGAFAKALEFFKKAEAIDSHYAELHFLMAKSFEKLNNLNEARTHYVLARDFDSLRFRADSRINNIIRELAAKNPDIIFVDAEQEFSKNSINDLPGENFFYEHVHFKLNGSYLLSKIFVKSIVKTINPNLFSNTQNFPDINSVSNKLALTKWAELETAKLMTARFDQPPFTWQFDHLAFFDRWKQQTQLLDAQLNQRLLNECLNTLTNAASKNPEDWVFHEESAKLLNRLGQYQNALYYWQNVANILPHYPEAHYQIGTLLDQIGQSSAAIDEYRLALKLNPNSPETYNALGLAYANLEKYDLAIKYLNHSIKLKPDFAAAYVNLGFTLSKLNKTQEAIDCYRTALKIKPDSVGALINLGKLLGQQGDVLQSVKNYEEAVKINPHDPIARFNYGNALSKLGKTEDAIVQFSEAVKLKPDFAEAHFKLGFEYARLKNDDMAMQEFIAAIQFKPDYAEAHLNLGVAYAKLHRYSEAVVHFETALKIDPNLTAARKYLDAARARLGSDQKISTQPR